MLTALHARAGPHFRSPEQHGSTKGGVDATSDLWGLGATLYTLLAGQPPFSADGETAAGVREEVLSDSAAPELRILDRGLAAVVGRLLQKGRESRFESVGEVGTLHIKP